MKRFYTGFAIIIFTGFILYLHSCAASSCLEETESFVQATFYKSDTNKPIAPDTVTLYGIGRDTNKLYNNTLKLLKPELPLFAADTSVTFILRINSINDTLEFIYGSYPHLLSKECGYTFYFTLEKVVYTIHAIDSIQITKSIITTLNEENMRIYY